MLEGGEIHEREFDRPLDLVGIAAGKEDGGGVGIDALHGLAKLVRGRIGKEGEDTLLIGRDVVRRLTHGGGPRSD